MVEELRRVWRAFTATWPMRLFSFWLLFFFVVFIYNTAYGKPEDRTSGAALILCAACTFLFWIGRNRVSRLFSWLHVRPAAKFVIAGSAGAVWVESVFWAFEKYFGASGIAANPNLAVDFAVTMPWYILMMSLLWKVVTRHRYSLMEVLFMGGVYDLFADGLLAGTFKGQMSPIYPVYLLVVYPIFFIAYSFMVLPPAAMLAGEIEATRASAGEAARWRRYLWALLPVAGLAPFLLLLLLIGSG